MTDHGHDLKFGTFVTPSAQGADRVVELAVTADRAGLDLVTFQDHPYQSSFLDTSTLLAFVAARTERVHVSAGVRGVDLEVGTRDLLAVTGGRLVEASRIAPAEGPDGGS